MFITIKKKFSPSKGLLLFTIIKVLNIFFTFDCCWFARLKSNFKATFANERRLAIVQLSRVTPEVTNHTNGRTLDWTNLTFTGSRARRILGEMGSPWLFATGIEQKRGLHITRISHTA
ncbi:hypothetical protein AVEN_159007-1 [Araneus ventricosus]|uniref:Uncharacterized protein n=1 Tax=Araneus ventricosus TaxID=182803 RepID=A0A4Y2B975_ARAVE|nr:hypothetical protein AVEN_159007-1 [Araneus ventricosus]